MTLDDLVKVFHDNYRGAGILMEIHNIRSRAGIRAVVEALRDEFCKGVDEEWPESALRYEFNQILGSDAADVCEMNSATDRIKALEAERANSEENFTLLDIDYCKAKVRVEQLEAEVERLKRVKLAHDAMEKWCGELTKKAEAAEAEVERLKGYLNEEERACEKAIITATKAEAQASRMREALKLIASTIDTFEGEGSYSAYVEMSGEMMEIARKALEEQ